MPGASSCGCGAPARAADDREHELAAEQPANASTSVSRFLRGSSVATVSRYGRPSSARSPSAVNTGSTPGCATRTRSRGDTERSIASPAGERAS